MKNKKELVLRRLDALAKKMEEQRMFETYEYMERPEIAVFAKGRATAWAQGAALLEAARKDIAALWPEQGERKDRAPKKARRISAPD